MGFPPMRSMFSDPAATRHDPFDDPFFRQPFGGGLFGGLLGSFFQGSALSSVSAFPQLQSSNHHHQQQQQQWQWQQQQHQQQEQHEQEVGFRRL